MKRVFVRIKTSSARFASLLIAALASCLGTSAEGVDTARIPSDVRADYELFTQRCSKCHGLARPLQSGITDNEYWAAYVDRMRRMPASGISPADATRILRFLRWYSADLRARRAAKEAP